MHAEARFGIVAPPARQPRQLEVAAVALVDEAAGDGAGPAIEVLVRAPAGEIDVPVVQCQRHVARGMGQIPADHAAVAVCGGGDPLHVEDLTREEVHARQQNQRDLLAQLLEQRLDRLAAQRVLVCQRLDLKEGVGGIKAAVAQVRLDRVEVGGERGVLHQDLLTGPGGRKERGQHQVQVHRQAVHHHDLAACLRRRRRCADEPAPALAQRLVIGVPRRLGFEMRIGGERGPIFELAGDGALDALGLKTEGVAGEVDDRLAAGSPREMKTLAERSQRILLVEVSRKSFIRLKVGVRHGRSGAGAAHARDVACGRKAPASRPRNSRAVPPSRRSFVSGDRSSIDSMSWPGSCSPSGNG